MLPRNLSYIYYLAFTVGVVFISFSPAVMAQENQEPEDQLDECEKLFQEQSFEQALACLEKRIETDPHNSTIYYRIAFTFISLQQEERGRQWFNRYLADHPDNVEALCGRSFIQKDLDPQASLKDIQKLLEIKPKLSFAWRLYSVLLWLQGQRTEAVIAQEQALRLEPGDDINSTAYAKLQVLNGGELELVAKWKSAAPENSNLQFIYNICCYKAKDFLVQFRFEALQQGKIDEAQAYCERIFAFEKQFGYPDRLGPSYNGCGLDFQLAGEYYLALGYFKQALQIARDRANEKEMGRYLTNIGSSYRHLGDYQQALSCYEKALAASQNQADKENEMAVLIGIGNCYSDLNNPHQALPFHFRALGIIRDLDDEQAEGICLSNIGHIYGGLGEYTQALKYYEQALAILRKNPEEQGLASTVSGVGLIYSNMEEYNKARSYFEEAKEIAKKNGDKVEEEQNIKFIGDVYAGLHDYPKAMPYYELALELSRQMELPDDIWKAAADLGNSLVNLNRKAEAVQYYEEAINAIEQISEKISDEQKLVFLEGARYVYEEYIQLLDMIHQEQPGAGHDRRAFFVAEKSKGRDIVDALAEKGDNVLQAADSALAAQVRRIRAEQEARRRLLADARMPEEQRRQNQAQLADLNRQLKDVQEKIRRVNPALANLIYLAPLELGAVQNRVIDEGEVLLEYYIGRKYSFLFVVTKTSYVLIPMQATEEELQTMIYGQADTPGLRDGLAPKKPEGDNNKRLAQEIYNQKAQQLYPKLARELSKKLVEDPLKGHPELLSAAKRLLIVPHGPLYGIPFEALPSEEGLLGERYLIRYGISATLMDPALHKDIKSAEGKFFAEVNPDFGPLPPGADCHERQEQSMALVKSGPLCPLWNIESSGKKLKDMAGRGAQLVAGKEATESKFKSLAPKHRNVFIGTHGLLDGEHPMYSMVVFAQGAQDGEDGKLHAFEVFDLDLSGVDLVTLAACQTGEGQPIGGSILGLSSAFLSCGARDLVVSLWSVDEQATAKLMELFYARLNKGMPAAQALAEAKKELRKITVPVNPRDPGKGTISYDQPYYWAGFVLIGR